MSQDTWNAVDAYLSEQLVGSDPVLTAALAASDAAGMPAIHVAPNQGKLLHLLARAIGARRVLEIGTLAGYSAIWLARALPAGGKLVTLEALPKHADVARANIERAGLGSVVELRIGKALDVLPALVAEGAAPFDLVFIDADKANIPEYITWSLKLARVGTVMVIDNVVREGEVVNAASTDASVQGVRRMNELLASNPRLDATAIQTVGSKGYDGLAIALVVS